MPPSHEARGVRHAGERERLLDRTGDAVQRWQLAAPLHERVGGVGFGARFGEAIAHHGVQRRIHPFDLLDVRLDRVARGERALSDQPRDLDGGEQAGVGHGGRGTYLNGGGAASDGEKRHPRDVWAHGCSGAGSGLVPSAA